MDEASQMQFENLKSAFNTQIQVLEEQLQDAHLAYNKKSKDFQEFVDKFMISQKQVEKSPYSSNANRKICEVMAASFKNRSMSQSKI